ncbi:AsmA family protein, partial [Pseudomonas aeruginosa]
NGRFSAEDITLGNPEWTAGKTKASEFASLERIEFRLAPLPLLWQTIRIPQIKLTQPRAEPVPVGPAKSRHGPPSHACQAKGQF